MKISLLQLPLVLFLNISLSLTAAFPNFDDDKEGVSNFTPSTSIVRSMTSVYNKPILQKLTFETVTITWLTDSRITPQVNYWTQLSSYSETGTSSASTVIQTLDGSKYMNTVNLSSLDANTDYKYIVMSDDGTNLMPNDTFKFTTALMTGSIDTTGFDFLVFGDYGTSTSSTIKPNKLNLRDVMLQDIEGSLADPKGGTYAPARFILTAGDNVYTDGTWDEWDERVFQPYGDVFSRAAIYLATGDHEYHHFLKDATTIDSDGYFINPLPLYEFFDLPVDPNLDQFFPNVSGESKPDRDLSEHFYSFDYGNAHFVIMDSEYGMSSEIYYNYSGGYHSAYNDPNGTPGDSDDFNPTSKNIITEQIVPWLENDLLSAKNQTWIFVIAHRPIYSGDGFQGAWGRNTVSVYEDIDGAGKIVDAVFGGDAHKYERSLPLLQGGRGNPPIIKSDGDAPVYFVVGAAAAATTNCDKATFNGQGSGPTMLAIEPFCDDSAYSPGSFDVDNAYYTRIRIYKDGVSECIQIRTIDHKGVTADIYDYCKSGTMGTGISNNKLEIEISVSPNPASHQITIDGNRHLIDKVKIVDITGKTLKTITSSTNIINVADLPQGIYFIKVFTESRWITRKIIIQ